MSVGTTLENMINLQVIQARHEEFCTYVESKLSDFSEDSRDAMRAVVAMIRSRPKPPSFSNLVPEQQVQAQQEELLIRPAGRKLHCIYNASWRS